MITAYLKKKVRDYCDKKYPKKLDVIADERFRPLFNHACHYNADAAVRQGDAIAVVECLIISDDHATLHYVSLRSDLKVFDGTLGPLWAGADYRLIEVFRDIPGDPSDRLVAVKRRLAKEAGLPSALLALYDAHAFL